MKKQVSDLDAKIVNIVNLGKGISVKKENLEVDSNAQLELILKHEDGHMHTLDLIYHATSGEFRCITIPMIYSDEEILAGKVVTK